jgi:arylsulfatase A-like enzyme
MAPHPPAVFGADGQALSTRLADSYVDASLDHQSAIEEYVGQLAYVNKRIEAAVSDLLSSASESTVVVIASDHGSRYTSNDNPGVPDAESVENFFSARTPGHRDLFGETPTLVNLFPTLLNAYLGTDFPQRANRSFVSARDGSLRLTEVTP